MKTEHEARVLRNEAEAELDDAVMAGEVEQARYWLGVKHAYDEVLKE